MVTLFSLPPNRYRRMLRVVRSLSMAAKPIKPLIAIVGATGTGKSDLAVEIARRFNGEIINGDAMQLYSGLPVITNKITKEEMKGVPHHLLGCIGLEQETWTVGKFVREALGKIDEIRTRGTIPVLVGGTHYYTQSLLFQDSLVEQLPSSANETGERLSELDQPTDVLLARLKEVDPVMADRWHPNDRRKIQRSLEIFLRTGKPASEVYKEQRTGKEFKLTTTENVSTEKINSTRFPTLVFWVYASKEVLYPRLDKRVDKMLSNGLLSEVDQLHSFQTSYEEQNSTKIDQTRGIWASIGYKEFLDYHVALTKGLKSTEEVEALKRLCIEKTQAATRQYANRQIRWIRIKLLNALFSADQASFTFLLDGSDLSHWEDQVIDPAVNITDSFLSGARLPSPPSLSEAAKEMLSPKREYDLSQRPDVWVKKSCEACGSVFVTENDWSMHVKSRGHRKKVGDRKKIGSMERQRAEREEEGQEHDRGDMEDMEGLMGFLTHEDGVEER